MESPAKDPRFAPLLQHKLQMGITFDEVLLVPQFSEIKSRGDIDLTSKFSRNIPLRNPIVSSPMDTVTEDNMAIGMARNGGLGIIHRFMSIEDQSKMVSRVKRVENYTISKPYIVSPETKIHELEHLSEEHDIRTFLVTEAGDAVTIDDRKEYPLLGIVTNRDFRTINASTKFVKDIMKPRDKLVVFVTETGEISQKDGLQLMQANKIEKIPLVNAKNVIKGLICLKDIARLKERPKANLDANGSLYVGAAVGAKEEDIERAKKLVDSGCDVLVVDIANGHSQVCVDAVEKLKQAFPKVDIVAGSVATGDGAERLIKAGADGIRCGIGNGSICITRLVAGAGVPQFTALMDVAPVCRKFGIPLISDGGNRNSGNMCKALAIGADAIMLGRLVAGCDESPGKRLVHEGRLVKIYRGMAGYGANLAKAQRTQAVEPGSLTFTPEGVEGFTPYSGSLDYVFGQYTAGIKSGMSYCASKNLEELRTKAKFIQLSASSIMESGVHDIKKLG